MSNFKRKNLRTWKKVFENDLQYIAYELKEVVSKPAVIFLNGELGAGKTTFIKFFFPDSGVSSPTYGIIHELNDAIYADFYRIENKDEILTLELPQYLESKNYFFLEWGLKYLNQLSLVIPEGFNFYELNIFINNEDNDKKIPSRDFYLSQINLE